MPATALVLPPQQVPVIDTGGLVSLPWRSSLQNALNNLQAQITALAALEGDTTALETALAALQAEVDAAEASIAAHIADTANPHATTAAQVGADPVGTATAAVAAHVALADPHTQYLTEAAATAGYQPLDATLTALAGANWALNALPIGTGADTVSQVAFAANTFPARASTGNLVAKVITDGALSAVAGSGGTAGFLRGDGAVTGNLAGPFAAADYVELTGNSANSVYFALRNQITSGRGYSFFSSGGGPSPVGTFGIYDEFVNATRLLIGTSGELQPGADNTQNLGSSGARWSEVFAGNGTINTSDARLKTEIRPFTDAELSAALELSEAVGFFRFLEAIGKKGDGAREHCGLTVQHAIEVMKSHGLDPFGYGFVCYDQWGDMAELRHPETGEVVQPARPAGDRYSFRPDQLDRFIAKGIRENQKRIEARLAALENMK